jgi:hypothetical protein
MRHVIIIATLTFCTCNAGAEEVSLGSAGKITGTIVSVGEENQITLKSPLSPDPLVFEGEQFESIVFDKNADFKSTAANMLYLDNADVLPVSLGNLDDQTLSFETSWAGNLQVKRAHVDSLHFGTSDNRVIYQGPNDKEWDLGKTWKYDNALVSMGYGAATRKFEKLPDRYIIGFNAQWTGNVGIKMVFASSSVNMNESTDCYFLQFNNGGLELKRQSTHGAKFTTLAAFNDFTPEQLDSSEIDVEIRIDSTNRQMQLAVNGKQLRSNIIDPEETGPVPTGTVISFICTSGQEDKHTIKNIRLTTWGSSTTEARSEKRTDTKQDVLFDLESNRSSGVLKSITPGKEPQILFENPHDPSPRPIPASKVGIIYFSGDKEQAAKSPYIIKLQDVGLLHVDSFRIADGIVSATHPLLGELRIACPLVAEIIHQK